MAQPELRVKVFVRRFSPHLSILYTGFGELSHRGVVNVEWVREPEISANTKKKPYLEIELNNQWRIAYDTIDTSEITDKTDFSKVSLVFKRSFDPAVVASHPHADQILPLGLYYYVVSPHDMGLTRTLWLPNSAAKFRLVMKRIGWAARLMKARGTLFDSSIEMFEQAPLREERPRILFMAGLWAADKALSPELQAERGEINAMRAGIVRRLRKEFGSQFLGGIQASDFANRFCPDCVITDGSLTRKDNYLQTMKASSICIATSGLEGSIGGKFAEYVAASKAIVSEVNRNVIPYGFEVGKNYLTFSTVDECVEQVKRLVDDPAYRYEMMSSNHTYYQNYLRPDRLVLHSLLEAVTRLAPERQMAEVI